MTEYGLRVVTQAHRKSYQWRPSPYQARVLLSPKRFKVLPAGRRVGKTEVEAIQALQWARAAPPRRPVWWVAPTYDACEPGLSAIEALWPQEWIKRSSSQPGNMKVETAWGATVSFRSAEKERTLRGRGLAGLLVDEAGEVPDFAWQVLRPALLDASAGALVAGTPKGRNWFHVVAGYDGDPAHPDWATFRGTTYDSPVATHADVEAMRAEMTDRMFRQEILAEFLVDSGGVFHEPRRCVVGSAWQQGALPGLSDGPCDANARHCAGWDVAKDQDWSVLVIDRAATRHTTYFDRFRRVPYPEQAKRVARALVHYDADVLVDSTGHGADAVVDLLRAELERLVPKGRRPRIYAYKFTHATKQNVIDNHAILVAQRATTWPDIPKLTNEHEIYEWKSGGRTGAPDGEGNHDDCVIAKALCTFLASRIGDGARGGPPLDLARYYAGGGPA